jgi:hypothetical protein
LIQDENHNSELREDDTSEPKSILESLPKDMHFAPSEELRIQDIVIKNEDFKENNTLDLKSKFKNQENILTAIDDLLISGGARLILFLPLFVVILFGLAQSFGNSNPDWWANSVQDVYLGLDISTSIYFASLLIMVADISLLVILLRLIYVTRQIFTLEADAITDSGITFNSAHGYAQMKAIIDGSSRQLIVTTALMILATILLSISMYFSINNSTELPIMIALSTGSLLAGHGVYMISSRTRFNTVNPWGLLDAFSTPIHPALLKRPFSDVIRSHVDPLLLVKVSSYVNSLSSKLRKGKTITDLQENLLHLLHLRRSGNISDDEFRDVLITIVDEDFIEQIFNHPELGEETWNRLLTHAEERCAPFFRLHDRLRMHYENDSIQDDDIWFDVDMENLTLGNGNLFAYVLNQNKENKELILRVQTPDFRPNECVYRLNAPPQNLPSNLLTQNIADTLPDLLLSTKIIWQSLIPASTGEATVTVRLEDTSGNLISGRVLTVQVRSDIFTRLRLTTGALFMFGAAVAVFSPLIPFALSLLGL